MSPPASGPISILRLPETTVQPDLTCELMEDDHNPHCAMRSYDVVRNRRSGHAHADSLSSGERVTSMNLRVKIANRYCAPSC